MTFVKTYTHEHCVTFVLSSIAKRVRGTRYKFTTISRHCHHWAQSKFRAKRVALPTIRFPIFHLTAMAWFQKPKNQ